VGAEGAAAVWAVADVDVPVLAVDHCSGAVGVAGDVCPEFGGGGVGADVRLVRR
jgi:hypothetical protein